MSNTIPSNKAREAVKSILASNLNWAMKSASPEMAEAIEFWRKRLEIKEKRPRRRRFVQPPLIPTAKGGLDSTALPSGERDLPGQVKMPYDQGQQASA